MKKILIILLLFAAIVSCQQTSTTNTDVTNKASSNGIYYWKTRFYINDYDLDFLKKHEISRIYVKMFDVALQNDSPHDTISVIPIATTRFDSSIPEGIEIVPTVYITYEALSHLKGKDREYIESYAQRILTRVDAMISYNEIQKVREVQFDCDWTSNTSYAYRCICDYAKRNLNKNGRKFSITLRLHQMGLENYLFPSADRGVLMLYNTGSFKNPNSTNSILSYNDAEPYIRRHEVPFPVDYAYPTYSWSLLFRNNEFKCIVRDIDLREPTLFQKSDYNRFVVRKDTLIENLQLRKGDIVRHETSEFKEIERVKSALSRRQDMKHSRLYIIWILLTCQIIPTMKSNICFLLISVLLFVNGAQVYACGPFEYYPYGYKMYRVFDKNSVVKPDERKENCILWQKLTSSEIPLEDIESVVYKYTLTQMKDLKSVQDPNAFATWIRTNEDEEIYDFLMLAKICENARGLMNDPWYYPSKNDGTYMSLIEIEEKVKAYKGTRLRDRYALQAVRAMFSAQRYRECIDYWNSVESALPDGLLKEMSRSYLVGAYSRIGQIDVALEYFTDVEDLNSIIFCLRRQGKIKDVADELECIAEYAPDSYQIPEILQWVVTGFEPWGSADYTYQERMDTTMVNSIDRELFDRLFRLSVKMTQEPVSKNRAVWCYTAAFLADMDAKPHEAWRYIQMATKCPTSEYMKESIKVLKMYLDAKVSVYDSAYESRLFNDLKWLDDKIRGELTEDLRNNISEYYYYYLRSNISFYYWNDMLRRIILAEVCPRMLDRGMVTRALQLANLADNMLLNLTNNIEGKSLKEYRASDNYNSIDYRSDFFMMMKDSVSISELIAYVNNNQSEQSTIFDKYLNERGFIDKDYFYDLIGTRYISELNYDKAVKYLSKVSSAYQSRLNTEAYMYRDPFSIPEAALTNHDNYKLTFAKEMLRLEKSIASAKDQSKKAFDLIRYGTGMRNSFTYCWILTEYRKFGWSYDLSPYANSVLDRVESIYNEALDIVDNNELAAIAHVQLCKWKTAVDKYPDTYAARYTKMMCDNLCDYSTNWVVRTTYDFQE